MVQHDASWSPRTWQINLTLGTHAIARLGVESVDRRCQPATAAMGDGVDAPRRHLSAKVEELIIHLKEASMGHATTIGLDIAKHVFQAHGADETGHVVFRKRLTRAKLLEPKSGSWVIAWPPRIGGICWHGHTGTGCHRSPCG